MAGLSRAIDSRKLDKYLQTQTPGKEYIVYFDVRCEACVASNTLPTRDNDTGMPVFFVTENSTIDRVFGTGVVRHNKVDVPSVPEELTRVAPVALLIRAGQPAYAGAPGSVAKWKDWVDICHSYSDLFDKRGTLTNFSSYFR